MKTALLTVVLAAIPLFGADTVFVPNVKDSKITFEIPFTGGIHRGEAIEVEGSLVLDGANKLVTGRFVVPIASMKTKNDTRDCHMREALGIDYTHSNFPAQHVCNQFNQTPETGPDSIAFPNLEFEFTSLVLTSGDALPAVLEEGKAIDVQLKGRFLAHGQSRVLEGADAASTLTGTLVKIGSVLNLKSTFPVVLKDYGIKVKPSKAGPVTITVGEKATVNLNLALSPN